MSANVIVVGPFAIEFDFTPADPGVRYHADGSGTPPTAAEFDTTAVFWSDNEEDVSEFLCDFLEVPETDLPGNKFILMHVRQNFVTAEAKVPSKIFDPWFKENESRVWDQISEEMEDAMTEPEYDPDEGDRWSDR